MRRLTALALLSLLAWAPAFAEEKAPEAPEPPELSEASEPEKASEETVETVERFLKTPTAELPPRQVEWFVSLDPETLPKRLRRRFKSKRLELRSLKQLTDDKKKGTVRIPDEDCSIPQQTKSKDALIIVGAGFSEVEEHEIACVSQRTKCTERDMMCEFSLQIVVVRKRGKVVRRRYFLHPNDPLMGVVAACREKTGGQTHFFGVGMPICSR